LCVRGTDGASEVPIPELLKPEFTLSARRRASRCHFMYPSNVLMSAVTHQTGSLISSDLISPSNGRDARANGKCPQIAKRV
jgi:hypothetical protein